MDNNKNKIEIGNLQRPEIGEGSKSDRKGEALALSNVQKVDDSLANKPGTSGTSSTNQKWVSASKRRYRNRRAALKIMDRMAATPEGQLTPEQRKSLAWAKAAVDCVKIDNRDPKPKRVRSLDEDEPGDSKRAKVREGTSSGAVMINKSPKLYTQVLKEHVLVLAVVDKGQEDGSLTMGKWGIVYNALNSVFLKVLGDNPGPPPSCRDVGWFQGRVKLMACADSRSAVLFRKAIDEVGEVWPGAKLAAVGRDEIPSRPRARVWLPTEPANLDEVLKIIQAGNPALPTGNWKIVRQEEAKGSHRQAVMVINGESLAPLAKAEGVINFGFGAITLKVYKKDLAARRPNFGSKEANKVVEPTGSGVGEIQQPLQDMDEDLILGMDSLLSQDSGEDDLSDLEEEEEEDANSTVVERADSVSMKGSSGPLEGTNPTRS